MTRHIPVLLQETIAALQIKPNAWYIDGTFGRGGHTEEILKLGGKVVAFDVDQEAISFGTEYFHKQIAQGQLLLIRENFERLSQEIEKLITAHTISTPLGALFDFGTSTEQLTSVTRGFSFAGDGDLDMRMDNRLGVKAKDLLMVLSEKQIADLFITFGGEHEARKIAKEIVKTRTKGEYESLHTTRGLTNLIEKVKRMPRGHLNPATKVFQALRIAVNDELGVIERVLPQALAVVAPQGRLVTIAFHEGEDRIVKNQFTTWEKQNVGHSIYKHPVICSEAELSQNSRARSAKLRAFEKI